MDKQWKFVPIEPTPEMMEAADDRVGRHQHEESRSAYAAMLAAAPQPPSASDERERFNQWSTRAGKYHASGYNPHDDLWEAWQAGAALAPSPGVDAAKQKPVPGTVAWVQNGIANFIADNWPMRKHTLAEIEAGIRAIEIRMPLDAAAPSPAASAEPHPPSRACMCAGCRPSFDNGADDPAQRYDITRGVKAASADEWMAEAERLVDVHAKAASQHHWEEDQGTSWRILDELRSKMDEARAALLDHLKARP